MHHDHRALLHDILGACDSIEEFTIGLEWNGYRESRLLRSAVERQFLIIGEALIRLHKGHPEVIAMVPQYRTIIDFRNVLVHGYDKIDNAVVWGLLRRNLPALRNIVRAIIAENP